MLITWFGRRGSGKTTAIRHMIASGKLKKPVIVPDILGNYEDDERNTYDRVVVYSHIEALEQIKYYLGNPKDHPGIIVVVDSDMTRAVDYISSALWKISEESKNGGSLVIDEADAISLSDSPCFDELIRYGRNRGIDLITGCRRPAEISKNVTAGADIAYCLTTHEPRDIEYYRDFLGDELAYQLPNLPHHSGVWRDFVNQKQGVFKTKVSGAVVLLKSVPNQGVKTSRRSKQLTLDMDQIEDQSASQEPEDAEEDLTEVHVTGS